jgi:uncharacterized protein YbjT (DUF2867 family)
MRMAVVGGTGLVGRHLVSALEDRGDEVVVISRSRGIDLLAAPELGAALEGVDTVIDVSNTTEQEEAAARAFFGTATERLMAAEQQAGVAHHVVLSIVGVDRVQRNGHYAGKRQQETSAREGPTPTSILRATQFFEFAEMVVGWTRQDGVATIPPLLVQPVAVSDVAGTLAEIATGTPQDGFLELAGPATEDLVDMARRALRARGDSVELRPSWSGAFGVEMAGEVLLPGPDARIAATTFEQWLDAEPEGV